MFCSSQNDVTLGAEDISNLRSHHELLCLTLQKANKTFQPVLFFSALFIFCDSSFAIHAVAQSAILMLQKWQRADFSSFIVNLVWVAALGTVFMRHVRHLENAVKEVEYQRIR
jgi:MFS-type transporter involved in bile tolerance (Atg22 family)